MAIMVWRSRMLDNLRPPSHNELRKAWDSFFKSKVSSKVPLNATQALQCRRLLEYFLSTLQEGAHSGRLQTNLQYGDVKLALEVLRDLKPREKTSQHLEFAKSLYAALRSGHLDFWEMNKKKTTQRAMLYASTVSIYGGSREALQELHESWEIIPADWKAELISSVAQGLAAEGLEEELVELIRFGEENGAPYDENLQTIVTRFFASQDLVPETKRWFEKETKSGMRATETYSLIAEFAARNNLQDWAIPFFLELGETKPTKPYWDSLLQAILYLGQGLKQVEALMTRMSDQNGPVKADTVTINKLLRVAVNTKDSLLAEEILSHAQELGLKMDGETYLIQMRMRLDAGYLPGVQAAYQKAKTYEPWQSNPDLWWEFSHQFNEYLDALSAQPKPDLKLIVALSEAAEEAQITLDPKTVAGLCVRLLENEQHFDVMDILSVHAFQFSAGEREVIQEAFTKFCLDLKTSTNRAWTCYQLLRQFFQDLSVENRVELMEAFFTRKRPDMAAHVFGHMRAHRNKDYHPDLDTYVRFFEGLGRHPNEESLEMVYNMMKMDTSILPNTRLYTSLILAHASCDRALQAIDFWTEITASREGPTYASLEAIFYALEKKPGGSMLARKIWKKIETMEVEVTPAVYNAYIGAIAGSGEEQEVQTLVMKMSPAVGFEPDAMT